FSARARSQRRARREYRRRVFDLVANAIVLLGFICPAFHRALPTIVANVETGNRMSWKISRLFLIPLLVAGCATVRQFPQPNPSGKTLSGQVHYISAKRSFVGDF